MKKFINNRVLPIVCALSISISLCIPFASAASGYGSYEDTESRDMESVYAWEAHLRATDARPIDVLASYFGVDTEEPAVFFRIVDGVVGNKYGEVTREELDRLATQLNAWFGQIAISDLYDFVDVGLSYAQWTLATCFGMPNVNFQVVEGSPAGYYRIQDTVSGLYVVNMGGMYPCAPIDGITSGEERSYQWIGEVTAADRAKTGVEPTTLDELNLICTRLRDSGIPAQIRTLGTNYKCIWHDRQVYADADGNPLVAWANENQSATNQERPDTTVNIDGENVDVIEGNQTNIDLGNMLVTLPNGSINFIDKIIYDESTKSYHIDSHDTYNYTVNNYYTWNYYINYTSITYIGQTEEYNKYYEVYYELPDGRDSADLTKEELEQLNLSIDVIPYGRSADDTSLRSLYHFDGDTRDSSYWNYCTDFTWNKGASLTYMDAGVFDGALYLDETEHDFTFTLPSMLSTHDFTLQFRYYQSATAAPQSDSYVRLGSNNLLLMSGGYFSNSAGTQLSTTPVGSWNEIALMREDGTLYTYLNGVCIGTEANATAFDDTITFHFGDEQQTFKYFDELRVLNYALQSGGANYECTSVPHDTNLALVLPDSALPVADEYWAWDTTIEPVWAEDLTLGYCSRFRDLASNATSSYTPSYVVSNPSYLYFSGYPNYTTVTQQIGYVSILTKSVTTSAYRGSGLYFPITSSDNGDRFYDILGFSGQMWNGNPSFEDKTLTFSLVLSDGEICSLTFDVVYPNIIDRYTYASASFDWGTISYYGDYTSNGDYSGIWINPNAGTQLDILYFELVEGDTPNTGHEWVESVTILDKEDLNTPTLAVRTDIDITSYQIGGVRPSVPEKGMVWALVENQRITSIQIYNGQAWEGVDGRIWTGQRWIPASSYNIVTLQDMYDIVDATPDFEYIYTESGFWSWWQKSWNAFTSKLFDLLGNGTSGGTNVNPDDLPSVPDDETTDNDDSWSFIDLLIVLKDGTWKIITGVVTTAYDGFSGFVESVSDAGGFFEPYMSTGENSIWLIPLEEGATIWD